LFRNRKDERHLHLIVEPPKTQVEDLLVTFVHYPVKTEPMINDNNDFNLPQLDGQTDFSFDNNPKQQKSVWEHMILAEQKLNTYRKLKPSDSYSVEQKIFPVNIPTFSKVIHSIRIH
jgi:hypothetical protein